MNYDLELSKEVFTHYINNEIGQNKTCKACRAYALQRGRNVSNGPIPMFHIGSEYAGAQKKVLILGTVAYGWKEELTSSFFDANKQTRQENLGDTITVIEERIDILYHETNGMRYFKFIKMCAEAIHGDSNAYSKIAISNLLKCNNGEVRNYNLQKTFDFCIREEHTGNMIQDIKTLNPTHIILLSGDYTKYGRYANLFIEMGFKTKMVPHPSSSVEGRLNERVQEIVTFINE